MTPELLKIEGPAGPLAVWQRGDDRAPTVVFSHSILASSAMWDSQANALAARGWHVLCIDTRGHGSSAAGAPPYALDDLVADVVAVLDALDLDAVHFVGLSLGGMIGLGLGIDHPHRLESLLVCDARADAPEAFAAPWDERIAVAARQGCRALAEPTVHRWFGARFCQDNPAIATRVMEWIAGTSPAGFIGCARALQRLDYLPRVGRIETPTTLLVGENDGPLPAAMKHLQGLVAGSVLEVIAGAGHLPNVDQPEAFNAALFRHFERTARNRLP